MAVLGSSVRTLASLVASVASPYVARDTSCQGGAHARTVCQAPNGRTVGAGKKSD